MLFLMQIILSIFILAGGVFVVVVGLRGLQTDDVTNRLDEYLAEAGKKRESVLSSEAWAIRTRELSGTMTTRILVPMLKRLGRTLSRITPAGMMSSLDQQLTVAGNPMGIGAREFYGIRMVTSLLGIVLAYLVLNRFDGPLYSLLAVLVLVLFFFLPTLLLLRRIRHRQDTIRRGMPDALDMLSVCASAGLGFDQSLQRVSEYWRTPIGIEFGRVVLEMEMGLSRGEALRNMADRLDVVELSTFVSLILQSEQLGMSISNTLHAQAEQMRIFRRFKAEEEIRKLPNKMLIPITFCIFPSILAVILGPSIPVLMSFFTTL
jgi:tight adherence protein C